MTNSWTGQERQRQKIQHMLSKRDKLAMIEDLITAYERDDPDYARDLRKRANEIRAQLKVASTQITKI